MPPLPRPFEMIPGCKDCKQPPVEHAVVRGQALRAGHHQSARRREPDSRVGGVQQGFVRSRMQLDREERSLVEKGVEITVFSQLFHQREASRTGEVIGRIVSQISAPCLGRCLGAFEAILPHGHARPLQCGAGTRFGEEESGALRIQFRNSKGPIQRLLASGRGSDGRG